LLTLDVVLLQKEFMRKRKSPFRRSTLNKGEIVGKMDPADCKPLMRRLSSKANEYLRNAITSKDVAMNMNHNFWVSYGIKLAMEQVHHFLLEEKWNYTNDIYHLVKWYEEEKNK